MKIECYNCGEEFDKDSPDIIYRIIMESNINVIYGFICRKCKEE
jgi:hypothetical protein